MPSESEVSELERLLDEDFSKIPLPSQHHLSSKWYLLTVVEEMLRLAILYKDPLIVPSLMDKHKYTLKVALLELYRRLPAAESADGGERSNSGYVSAASFLRTCEDYDTASLAFTSYHTGHAECTQIEMEHKFAAFKPLDRNDTMSFFDMLAEVLDPDPPLIADLLRWITTRQPPTAIEELAHNARILADGRVVYSSRRHVRDLYREPLASAGMLPASWSCPLGTSVEVRRFFSALHAFCVQHVAANFFAAVRYGRKGFGYQSSLLVRNRAGFEHDLAFLSGIPLEQVGDLLKFATYGQGVKTPDPALQPIIPMQGDKIAIPCLITASGDAERNFLSLLARVDKKAFDAASHHFELCMTERVQRALTRAGYPSRSNVVLPGHESTAGEIDVVAFDPKSRAALVLELRWMIPAGEPHEVWSRETEIPRKRHQARVKLQAVSEQLEHLLRLVGIPSTTLPAWRVEACVVLDGFSASRKEDETIQVVTVELFERALERRRTLMDSLSWMQTDECWPVLGSDVTLVPFEAQIGDTRIAWARYEIEETGFDKLRNLAGPNATRWWKTRLQSAPS